MEAIDFDPAFPCFVGPVLPDRDSFCMPVIRISQTFTDRLHPGAQTEGSKRIQHRAPWS